MAKILGKMDMPKVLGVDTLSISLMDLPTLSQTFCHLVHGCFSNSIRCNTGCLNTK